MNRCWQTVSICLGLIPLAGCPQASLDIQPDTLPNGVESQPFEVDLGIGTDARQEWSVISGALPAGVLLDGQTGVLSGTPTQSGDFPFTIQALERSGLSGQSGQRAYSLHIIAKLRFSGILPAAHVGEVYSQEIPLTGGVEPYQITVIGLPGGLNFDDATDTISGTPLTASTGRRLDITVHDSGTPQQAVAVTTQLVIKPPPLDISTTDLPSGRVNQAYSGQLEAVDGLPPYTWGFVTTAPGRLPDGLALNTSTGAITGTPTTAGTSTFTIKVTDTDQPATTDSRAFSILITP